MSRTLLIVASFLIAATLGSAASAADSWAPWPFHHDEPAGKPDKVISLWTDAVMTRDGQSPIRGFGGRLMFYEGKNDTPVKIEGTLVVYAFDETNRDPNNAKPDCKYVITPEQLPNHYSKSKAGHSYSVWIPWDQAGGMQKEITLVVRYEPKNGPPVIGEQCREILSGRLPPGKPDPANRLPTVGVLPMPTAQDRFHYWPDGSGATPAGYPGSVAGQGAEGVRPASFESPQPPDAAPATAYTRERRMSTATIAIPDGLALRRALSAPEAGPPQAARQPAPNSANSWPAANPAWRNGQAPGQSYPLVQPAPGQSFQGQPVQGPSAQGQPPQAGSALARQRALGEPLARLSRDRGPWPPRPSVPQYVPATQPMPANSNVSPAAPANGLQSPYPPGSVPR
jgi:hypothetical protein